MSRLKLISPDEAEGATKELLSGVSQQLGMVPNIMRALANSPAALQAYLGFSGALSEGSLSAKLRERISLAISERNGCSYCVAAHNALGKMAGLSVDDIRDARSGKATDSKTDAAVRFAVNVLDAKGFVTDKDLDRVQRAGYSDGEIAEIVAMVALNVFTNYFNHVVATEIDFPPVKEMITA